MKSLLETNVYLRKPAARRQMIVHNALESSIFEGASGLRTRKAVKPKVHVVGPKGRSPLTRAASKKAVKGS